MGRQRDKGKQKALPPGHPGHPAMASLKDELAADAPKKETKNSPAMHTRQQDASGSATPPMSPIEKVAAGVKKLTGKLGNMRVGKNDKSSKSSGASGGSGSSDGSGSGGGRKRKRDDPEPPPSPGTAKRVKETAANMEKAAVFRNLISNVLPEDRYPVGSDERTKLFEQFNAFPDHSHIFGLEGQNAPLRVQTKDVRIVTSELLPSTGHRGGHLQRRVLRDGTTDLQNPVEIGDWARKFWIDKDQVKPGDIIMAPLSAGQNDLALSYPSANVRIFRHGPVFSKPRPMVVLWHTNIGMTCAPMWTLKAGGSNVGKHLESMAPERQEEFMHITPATNKTWVGHPLASSNGSPLLMNIFKTGSLDPIAFVDLSHTVWISRFEDFEPKLAGLTRASYVRLMEAVTWHQHAVKENAFNSLGLELPDKLPIKPTKDRTGDQRARWIGMRLTDDEIDGEDPVPRMRCTLAQPS